MCNIRSTSGDFFVLKPSVLFTFAAPFKLLRYLDIKILSQYPNIPISQYPNIPISQYPNIPISQYPVFTMSYIIGTLIQQGAKIGGFVGQPRQSPAQLQEQQLRDLLWEARHTAIGLEYNFKDILRADNVQPAFKKAVPVMDYQALYDRWWSRAHLEDEPDVCWPGLVPYFALSSGTSQAATKYLPLTEDLLRGMKRGSRRLFYDMAKFYGLAPEHYTKQMLMVGSCTQQKRVGYHWEGDLSGIMGMNRPRIMDRSYRPGRHITDLPEWGERIERIAEEAPQWDIGFSVSNPMWLQLILERIIEKHKLAHINEIWPSFNVFIHGGVPIEPYKPTLEPLFGKPILYMDSYGASEGFLAYQERPDHRPMKLLNDCGVYFEFVPFDEENFDDNGELRSDQPRSLELSEVEVGKHYALLLSLLLQAPGDTFWGIQCSLVILKKRKLKSPDAPSNSFQAAGSIFQLTIYVTPCGQ